MGEWHLNFRRPSRAQLQRKQVANTLEVDKPLLIGGRMCDLWRRSLKVLPLLFPEYFVFGVPVPGASRQKWLRTTNVDKSDLLCASAIDLRQALTAINAF